MAASWALALADTPPAPAALQHERCGAVNRGAALAQLVRALPHGLGDLVEICGSAEDDGVRVLPPAPLGERFTATMRAKLDLLTPHRAALAALFGAALDRDFATCWSPRSPSLRRAGRTGCPCRPGPLLSIGSAGQVYSPTASASSSTRVPCGYLPVRGIVGAPVSQYDGMRPRPLYNSAGTEDN
jgi:hypothetical protein